MLIGCNAEELLDYEEEPVSSKHHLNFVVAPGLLHIVRTPGLALLHYFFAVDLPRDFVYDFIAIHRLAESQIDGSDVVIDLEEKEELALQGFKHVAEFGPVLV